MRAKDRNRGTGGEPNSGCFFGSEPGYHHGVDDNYHDDDLTVAFALTYPRQISFWRSLPLKWFGGRLLLYSESPCIAGWQLR